MTGGRPLPWTDLVAALGEERLEAVRSSLAEAGTDPLDRDAFLLNRAVAPVLRELVPADAPAEAVTSYGGLLHAIYAHWDRGSPVRALPREAAAALLGAPPQTVRGEVPEICYVQLPERLVWAAPAEGAAHEPLDGVFVLRRHARMRVLAVLGFRPARQGFTTIEAEVPFPPPRPGPRADGAPPFATALPAGERMGFFAVASAPELAFLALLAVSEAPR